MIRQSKALAALAVAGLLLLSGCTAAITGDEPVEFAADPAGVDGSTLEATNYELSDEQELTMNRPISVADQERTVIITNHMKTYQKQGDNMHSTGLFTVFSTPSAKIAGQPVNPITSVSNDRLVSTVLDNAENDQINNIEKVDEYTLVVNGEETVVTKYEGTTTVEGQQVKIYLHLTKIEIEDDTVVALGMYPKMAEDMSGDDMDALMKGLQHDE